MTVINDPDTTVTFDGSGVSDATGPVQLNGTWQRDTSQTGLTCDAPNIPIGPPLVQRLSGFCPGLAEQARDLSGNGKLHATFDHHPGAMRPWEHDVTLTLTQGKFRHQQLPAAARRDHRHAALRQRPHRSGRGPRQGRHGVGPRHSR